MANVSLMFQELSLAERLALVRRAGIQAVEMWWPFSSPSPRGREVDTLGAMLDDTGLSLVAMNVYAGNQLLGDRGVVTRAECADDVLASADTAAQVAEQTGCHLFNVPLGAGGALRRDEGAGAVAVLAGVADRLGAVGATVLVEPMTRQDPPPSVMSSHEGFKLVERLLHTHQVENCGLLLDVFHLVNNGEDPAVAIREYAAVLRHVQVADAPGRGRPGTGDVDFVAVFAALDEVGYAGHVACEYLTADPGEELAWLRSVRQLSPAG